MASIPSTPPVFQKEKYSYQNHKAGLAFDVSTCKFNDDASLLMEISVVTSVKSFDSNTHVNP